MADEQRRDPDILAGWSVKEGREIYEQRQERQRQTFEQDQERKRQAFEERIEQQKATRDKVMLLLTGAAVIVAFVSSWIAYKARMDAIDASEKSLSVQQKSVDAQIAAMRLEQRPFIRFESATEDSRFTRHFNAGVTISVAGKTPAFDIRVRMACESTLGEEDVPELLARARSYTDKDDLENIGFAQDGDIRHIVCLVNRATNAQQSPPLLVVGQIDYLDFFKQPHHSTFCYFAPPLLVETANNQRKMYPCTGFVPEIT